MLNAKPPQNSATLKNLPQHLCSLLQSGDNCLGPSSDNQGSFSHDPFLPPSYKCLQTQNWSIRGFWQNRLNKDAVMRLSRNKSCWDFRLLGFVQFVPVDIHPRLKQCAACVAPLGLTPLGASKNVMPPSPIPADARCWVLWVQGLPMCRFRGFGSPRHRRNSLIWNWSWFWTLRWSLHCFLTISRFLRMSDPAQPSTRFSKDLFLP